MRFSLPASALLFAGLAQAAPSHGGWVEAHLTGSDARLRVERDAHAAIDLTLTYRVVAGTLHSVEIAGARFDTLEPACEVRAEDGSAQQASVVREGDLVKLAFEGKGLRRGSYAIHLRGGVVLVPISDGAMWRVTWSSPVTNEGLDGARIVLDLPAAPTEPRAIRADASPGEIEERDAFGIVATLRRDPSRDALELVRPHVARGEGAMWAARVDPKAFDVPHPSPGPAFRAPSIPPSAPVRAPLGVLLAAVGLAVCVLVWAKGRGARAIGVRPLLPIPGHSLLAGAAMAGAVWLEAIRQTTEAALAITVAMLLSTFVARARRSKSSVSPTGCVAEGDLRLLRSAPKSSGAWTPMRSAVPERPMDPFDATRGLGAAVLCVAVIALVGLARMLSAIDPLAPVWVALDAVVLVPLFFTGIRPGPGPIAGAEILREVRERLADVKTALVGCVPPEGGEPSELRLHAQPAAPMPGLTSLEVAVRWDRSGTGFAPALEVLARIRSESSAHERLLAARELAPALREPGRKPDERVFRYAPEAADFDRVLRTLWSMLEERRHPSSSAVATQSDRRRSRLSSAADVRAAAH